MDQRSRDNSGGPAGMDHERLPAVELDPPGVHSASVIWLHGLGADGHDFEPLVAELALPRDHGLRFVFPHAPERALTLYGGERLRAWYDIVGADPMSPEDAAGIHASAALIEGLIAREQAIGIAANRIVLAGFSQGGAMALHTGLRFCERLAGLIVLSAYLPLAAALGDELRAANRLTPIFQAHGLYDPTIPLAWAERSHAIIAALRPAPEWHSYPLGHEVGGAEIADLRRWLLTTLDDAA